MVDLMWRKCCKSSEGGRRKKGQPNVCLVGRNGSGCGGRVPVSAPVGLFLCCVFCLVCRCLLRADQPSSPQWRSPQWSRPPCCARSLSEVVLRNLERYIDSNDMKLLETKRHMRAPPISSPKKREDKIKSLREEYERRAHEEGSDEEARAESGTDADTESGADTESESEAETESEEESKLKAKEESKIRAEEESKIEAELQHENPLTEELTEQQFDRMVGKLRGYIETKDMYALWNYVHTNGKKKYLSLKEELWKDCENMCIKYNIPEEFTIKEWRKAYLHLKDELLKKERDDYMDLKVFIDAGLNLRWEFIAFIINKYESWDVFIDTAMDNWKKSLSKIFEKYVEDAQEKEIERNPKTGAKVSSISKYNEETEIMVSEILL
ncbi:unnamed protein product [Plasmodium vivax]|uniref:(malaria parasite P. vivax) hypothetical protein n=1 Tax=Plasmodium vivax TaxID=5855 RepID=A0A8S4HE48_PLAVI|nr:unnamed protein product [Plasmodium vivax]